MTNKILHSILLSFGLLFAALAQAEQVSIGYLSSTGHAKFFIAQEQGFFQKNGLEVRLVEFQNSGDGIAAVRAGKLDAGAFGTIAPMLQIASGADIRFIGGLMGEDAAIITQPDKTVKSVAELRGKTVATVRLASGDAVFRGALKQAGLDWRKDVTILELKNPPAVIEAVRTGKADAGVTWGPHDVRAEDLGLTVVLRSRDLAPGHACCRLIALGSKLQKSPDVYRRILKSLLEAEKFADENHEATAAIIAKYIRIDPATVKKAYYSGFLDQTTDPNKQGLVFFWNTARDADFVKSEKNIADYIDTGLYQAALEELRREAPSPFYESRAALFATRN